MKHFSSLAFLMGMFFVAMVAVGCDDDNDNKVSSTPSVSVSLSDVSANSAVINLTTNAISQYAYICVEDTSTVVYDDEAVLFRTGETVSVSDGDNELTIYPIYPNTYYILYLAFQQTDGSYYGEVISLAFMTTDVNEEGLTLVSTSYDGFTMYIKMPESTIAADHAIRYLWRNIAVDIDYNGGDENIVSNLQENGGLYTTEDASVTFNNNTLYDENGEQVHDAMCPGEPIYFYAGEFSWGEGIYGNWSDGYYTDEFSSGNGFYQKYVFRTKMPSELDASLNISVEDITAVGANVIVEPDDNIVSYCIMVVDDASYHGYVLPMLDNNEDYLQWFITSWYANYLSWSATYSGGDGYWEADELNIADQGLGLEGETTYYVLAVGLGDDEGSTQVFEEVEFTTLAKESTAPELVVTALDANPETGVASPYEAWFNVKATNGDVITASYLADYDYAWRDYTPSTLMSSYGTSFSDDEISAINSSSGYNIYFTSRAGATTRLAVLAYNEEYISNSDDLDSDDPSCIGDCTTIQAEAKASISTTLFDDLCGEWTMSYAAVTGDSTVTGTVNIARQLTYDSTPSREVYSAYSNYSTAYVDSLWNVYKEACEYFNTYDLTNQNRLLCTGFSTFDCATPYELFTSSSYSAYDSEEIIYDFGPKWYLEVIDEDTVAVPVNTVRQLPASAWESVYFTYYILGFHSGGYSDYIAYDDDYEDAYFDVTISDDGDTLTIAPIVSGSTYYYLNMPYINSSYAYGTAGKINASEVTLVRNSTASTSAATVSPAEVSRIIKAASADKNAKLSARQHRTPITGAPEVKKYNVKNINVVNKASAEAGLEKLRQHYAERSAKLNTK